MGKSKFDSFQNKVDRWISRVGSFDELLSDIRHLSVPNFNTKYGTNWSSEKSLISVIGNLHRSLAKIKSSDIKYANASRYSRMIEESLSNRRKGINPPPPPPPPPPFFRWKILFSSENPKFSNEKRVNPASLSAETGFYFNYSGYLRQFVASGRHFVTRFMNIIGKLTMFFNGRTFFKDEVGGGVKILLYIQDITDREVGKTFVSFSDFRSNFVDWLESLAIRFQDNDGNYDIAYTDTFLKFVRISTYMQSNNFARERSSRFSLYLRYLH